MDGIAFTWSCNECRSSGAGEPTSAVRQARPAAACLLDVLDATCTAAAAAGTG